MPWATFPKAHWGAIAAMDFFKVEVMTLTDAVDGFLIGKTYVIMDRDPVFTACVRDMLRHAGAKPVRLPRRSPNLNAFIEGFIRSIREECLDRVIPLGEAHLRELIREYMAHYHMERPHQGLEGKLIQPTDRHGADGPLVRRERLGACSIITIGKLREFRAIQ